MSGCLWCEYDHRDWCDDTGRCVQCGATHEFDGDVNDSGDWRCWATLAAPGRINLRADSDESLDCLLRDVLRRVVDREGPDSSLAIDAAAALKALQGCS